MNAFVFLVDTLFSLYLMVVLLRLWLQFAQADFYNPFSQFVVKATHPIVGPLRRMIPAIGRLDTATLLLGLLVAAGKIVAISMVQGALYLDPLGILKGAFWILLLDGIQLIIYVLFISAIFSWVSQGYNPLQQVFDQLTAPILNPIRKVIPSMGGLDLSVMIAIIGLYFVMQLLKDLLVMF